MSLTFSPVSTDDLETIAGLVQAVSWPHRPEDIDLMIRLGGGRLVHDANDGQVLGVGLYWTFGDALARIGLIIVSPESQGRGIGRKLVTRLLEDAGPRPVVLLATDAGRPLYESLGFKAFDTSRQYQGIYADTPGKDPRIRPGVFNDIAGISDLDAAAFGARREHALESLAAASDVSVLTENGTITGYGFARAFGRGTVIGPIVSANEADAIALFSALARPGFVRVDCPGNAAALIRHLTGSGLEDVGTSPVMARGDWTAPAAPHRIYGLASHALG
ncbi:GNAT family N-acetyltransferase [Nisaea nitritireducens]|uniref:GNAT family N-acetyltransferase n=1 Tax=Nisaea nitritireducens TaxID=568392 RepID=UPI001869424B|nr:GNAT family N-acetyltransferase [Nisaea nitritireducens]